MKRFLPASIALLLIAAGCDPGASESDEGPAKPKVVAFQGEVDPSFVGLWKTAKETSCLDLRKDGTAKIMSAVPTPKGIEKASIDGKWLVSNGNLLLKYTVPNQTETTVKYPATLAGKQLTLDQGSRSKMVYTRS